MKKDIDFIIVGSGPGGATVAKELSQRKKKVCILEWGDNDPLMVKAKDELGGRLTNSGGIRKILDENEKQKLSRGYERAKKILENAGAKGIFKTGYLAAHPGGTVKVGKLIDSNLKTEYENLYVCDCSVIPEAWGLPPTSTIIGLGKRLAKYLAAEKQIIDAQRNESPDTNRMDQEVLAY